MLPRQTRESCTYALGLDAQGRGHAGEAGHAQEEDIQALARLNALLLLDFKCTGFISNNFFRNAPDYQPQNSQVPLSRKISAGEEAM